MIEIFIQESEAFDRLSILEIKRLQTDKITVEQRENITNQIKNLQSQINDSIGYDLAKKIYCSDAYTALFNANENLFNKIEELKQRDFSAREFGDLIHNRYLTRQRLQKEFFNNQLQEIKIGFHNAFEKNPKL